MKPSRDPRAAHLACVAIAALGSGCLIVPKTRTTKRTLGTSVAKIEEGPAGPLSLSMRVRGPRLEVEAVRPRRCVEHLVTEVEVTRHVRAGLATVGAPNHPYAVIAFILAAPVTGLVSGMITSVVVANNDGKTSRRRIATGVHRTDCPIPAEALRVRLALPSGRILEGITDAKGRVDFEVPADEPRSGTVIARTASTRPKAFLYGTAADRLTLAEIREGLGAVRPAIQACGRRAGLAGRPPLTVIIEQGRSYLGPESTLNRGFAACADAALHDALFRSAPRAKVTYRVRFTARRASGDREPRIAVPAEQLRQLRRDCAIPIARWRAGEAVDLSADCRALLGQ